jgi:hypothetical protein
LLRQLWLLACKHGKLLKQRLNSCLLLAACWKLPVGLKRLLQQLLSCRQAIWLLQVLHLRDMTDNVVRRGAQLCANSKQQNPGCVCRDQQHGPLSAGRPVGVSLSSMQTCLFLYTLSTCSQQE